MTKRRLWVCLLGGVLAALICLLAGQIIRGFPTLTLERLAASVANRLLLGFAIGISGWRIHHLLHGAVLGLVVSLSVSIGVVSSDLVGFFLYTAAGVGYGLLIEWLATDVFKAPMHAT
jgi:hypothetical protein